ncbi:hypothetical protein N7495_001415 [Penicillium taxi]|uniref:uncharacterized protein n=1 Tax=Penicillium taxi TaxID=168475 RepID=UPI002544E888|nr:uncharacterized protein N7495_001415 [Penicillium taxi]KAJ5908733.1 hypothetical protein N7495_001415 [Penicillium taxi]
MIVERLFLAFMLALGIVASVLPHTNKNESILDAPNRLVFSHFMMGITSTRKSAADYDDDMKRAKALGIDAFALNIGTDPFTEQQLEFAFESAATNSMKVFLSFDFNWWKPEQVSTIGQRIVKYASKPGQLMVDNKIFVSSFSGDGLDVAALRAAVGKPIFFAPNFHPSQGTNIAPVDGLLNWIGWPNNGENKAPTASQNVTVKDGDDVYIKALSGKAYIAPVSPWFFTHFGAEVSYSKNWVFPSDLLWYNRWREVLSLGSRFIEIITWNDYGESHYIGPLSSPHTDDGASRWANDMPHSGWLDMSKPFIAAFKAGASSPDKYITKDELIYWYRPAPRDVNCDATDTCMGPANNGSGNYFEGRPDGWQSMSDSVFVVSLLTAPASVTVNSGGTVYNFDAPAGAYAQAVPMHIGTQVFSVSRGGKDVLSGTSLKPIIDGCQCGLYNFNAYVGTLPPGPSDPLLPEGLGAFTQGLRVTTCRPTPSLGTKPPTPPTTSTSSIPTTPGSSTSPPTSSPPTTSSPSKTSSPPGSSTPPPPTSTPPDALTPPTTKPAGGCSAVTTTISSIQPTSPTSGDGSNGGNVCIAGQGQGNFIGLCAFACRYGYCPSGPCTCIQYGAQVPVPPKSGGNGTPLKSEDNSYLGLCAFACSHGYCPSTACAQA